MFSCTKCFLKTFVLEQQICISESPLFDHLKGIGNHGSIKYSGSVGMSSYAKFLFSPWRNILDILIWEVWVCDLIMSVNCVLNVLKVPELDVVLMCLSLVGNMSSIVKWLRYEDVIPSKYCGPFLMGKIVRNRYRVPSSL